MTDQERLQELPPHIRASAKTVTSGVDYTRMGAMDLEVPEGVTDQKGEFDGYTLGTDGDPGDADEVYAFLDELVDAGGQVWQVRDELYVWPDDEGSFPIHDPAIKVIGVTEEELEAALESHDVDFLQVSEGV